MPVTAAIDTRVIQVSSLGAVRMDQKILQMPSEPCPTDLNILHLLGYSVQAEP